MGKVRINLIGPDYAVEIWGTTGAMRLAQGIART